MILKVHVSPTGYGEFAETPEYGLVKIDNPIQVAEELQKLALMINDNGFESIEKTLHDEFVLVEDEYEFDPNKDFDEQVEEVETFTTKYDEFHVFKDSVSLQTSEKYSNQGYECYFTFSSLLPVLESGEEFYDFTK